MKTCTNCPGATDHSTAECWMGKDRELLLLSAKAAGFEFEERDGGIWCWPWTDEDEEVGGTTLWGPGSSDRQAFWLAVRLRLHVLIHKDWVEVLHDGIRVSNADSIYDAGDMFACARRAILLASADIGRAMP